MTGHRKPLRRTPAMMRWTEPEPAEQAIYDRYGDTCHVADVAFLRGDITASEMQAAREVAAIVRDASLAILRQKAVTL